ncbi:MAG: hypothetical protein H0V92_11735 [Pseudonocardiales bacterium]|nr:hypothetical protein [Pseudonocardiales bacterium]
MPVSVIGSEQRAGVYGPDALGTPRDPLDLAGYVEAALRGGLPEAALQPDARLRRRWLTSYVDEIVVRDGALVDGGRDPVRLRRYLQAWAANTAGVPEHKTLYEAAEINRATAVGYDRLLYTLLVVDPVPAWSTNRLARLTSAPNATSSNQRCSDHCSGSTRPPYYVIQTCSAG